jgi:hypothetical protein
MVVDQSVHCNQQRDGATVGGSAVAFKQINSQETTLTAPALCRGGVAPILSELGCRTNILQFRLRTCEALGSTRTLVSLVTREAFPLCVRKGAIPFVIGPINVGLPWLPGLTQLVNPKEWISDL